MAEFSYVGAHCAVATCGQQDFLPFKCNGCNQSFCQNHYKKEDHSCEALSASPSASSQCPAVTSRSTSSLEGLPRCAVPSCREQLTVQNRVHCNKCGQDTCLKHRFEDQHPCVDLQAVAAEGLRFAQIELKPEEFLEAHKTMSKILGNIIADPKNEKFRTLRKTNAVVKEKLRHPACIQALSMCGFVDDGEHYVCPMVADLSAARHVLAALKAHSTSAAATPAATGGTRLVNGVIVRQKVEEPSSSPSQSHSGGYAGGPKPKSAFNFKRPNDTAQQQKAQADSLQEIRRQQKERYREAATGGSTSYTGGTVAAAPPKSEQHDNINANGRTLTRKSEQQCCIQ
eukprot:TRINITY_DN8348_c3_g1_i1.p1 TRINITY_DN8348_c3_g1~~TRINITY_DN8348_c3_g1_i1.p1  ORF type:complete len:349 (+),score=55.81 TRINITY_DN8348_c3_g1_i1:23-1048(+)